MGAEWAKGTQAVRARDALFATRGGAAFRCGLAWAHGPRPQGGRVWERGASGCVAAWPTPPKGAGPRPHEGSGCGRGVVTRWKRAVTRPHEVRGRSPQVGRHSRHAPPPKREPRTRPLWAGARGLLLWARRLKYRCLGSTWLSVRSTCRGCAGCTGLLRDSDRCLGVILGQPGHPVDRADDVVLGPAPEPSGGHVERFRPAVIGGAGDSLRRLALRSAM